MSTVTLKDVPERLHRRLKARARENRRSLNREIISRLEEAASVQKLDPDALLARAAAMRRRVSGRLTDRVLAASRQSGRP